MRLFEDFGDKVSDLFHRHDWSLSSCIEVAASLFSWQGCLASFGSLVLAFFVIGTFVTDWTDNIKEKLDFKNHVCEEHAWINPSASYDHAEEGKIYLYCGTCKKEVGTIEPETREEIQREYYLYEGETCHGFYAMREKWTCTYKGEVYEHDTVYYTIPDVWTHEYQITRAGTLPTCFDGGYSDEITCTKCNEIVLPYTELPPAGHSLYVGVSYSATCEHGGYTGDVRCRGCDYFEEGTYTPQSTEHAYRVWGDVQIEKDTGRKFKMMICDWCQRNHKEYLN